MIRVALHERDVGGDEYDPMPAVGKWDHENRVPQQSSASIPRRKRNKLHKFGADAIEFGAVL